MEGWKDGRMEGWMNGWMDEWMNGWKDAWMHGWMDGWMDEWMNGWMDEWMDAWMHGCMDAWMNGWKEQQNRQAAGRATPCVQFCLKGAGSSLVFCFVFKKPPTAHDSSFNCVSWQNCLKHGAAVVPLCHLRAHILLSDSLAFLDPCPPLSPLHGVTHQCFQTWKKRRKMVVAMTAQCQMGNGSPIFCVWFSQQMAIQTPAAVALFVWTNQKLFPFSDGLKEIISRWSLPILRSSRDHFWRLEPHAKDFIYFTK
jgi:hypothetical protein